MIELQPPHDDARRRFEELAAELRTHVVRFNEPSGGGESGFAPEVFKAGRLVEENLVGDPIVWYQDGEGDTVGMALAELGGTRLGLVREGYRKLQALVRAMCKARPFVSTASASFMESRIFTWTTSPPTDKDCVHFVLEELRQAAGEHRVIVPISELYVAQSLAFGRVTITTFPERILQHLEAKEPPAGPERDQHRAFCRQLRSDFQGLAVADATVTAEPGRAQELAIEQIELVVGVIRLIAPANVDPAVVSRIARWGYAPQRTAAEFVTDPAGTFRELKTSLIDSPGRAVIDEDTWKILLGAGLAEVREIVMRDERSRLEEALLAGIMTFGRAALTPDLRERLVWYCAGLESLLLKNSSEPVLQNLSERLALIAYDSVDERATALKDIRGVYSLRSDFVHHGVDVENRKLVGRLARHGVKLFLRIAKNLTRFKDKQSMLEHVDRMKMSGT